MTPTAPMQQDAMDKLIQKELLAQETWRQTMQRWEERQARQQTLRRRRYLAVLTNVAQVAAMLIVVFIWQANSPRAASISTSVMPAGVQPSTPSADDGQTIGGGHDAAVQGTDTTTRLSVQP